MIRKLMAALRHSGDLARDENKTGKHPLAGLCYVACEALYHSAPGKFRPYVLRHEGINHWFLKYVKTNRVVDPTVQQFENRPNYLLGRPCGFLTREPSKRARILLGRMKQDGKLEDSVPPGPGPATR